MELPGELIGTWLRSAEDDAAAGRPGAHVYRPLGHGFPPARAPRPRLHFATDGALSAGGPAPADAPVPRTGTWRLDGDSLVLHSPGLSGRFHFRVSADTLELWPE